MINKTQKLDVKKTLLKSGVGFTLIETVLYVSLLSFILASLLGITYQALESTDKIAQKIALQQEANFIVRKIDWALGSAAALSQPLPNFAGPNLTFTNFAFAFIGSNITLNSLLLNSANVSISGGTFSRTVLSGQPEKIQVDFDINCANCSSLTSQHFTFSKYLRN